MKYYTLEEEEVCSQPDEMDSVPEEDAVVSASPESICVVPQYNEPTIAIDMDVSGSGNDPESSTGAFELKPYCRVSPGGFPIAGFDQEDTAYHGFDENAWNGPRGNDSDEATKSAAERLERKKEEFPAVINGSRRPLMLLTPLGERIYAYVYGDCKSEDGNGSFHTGNTSTEGTITNATQRCDSGALRAASQANCSSPLLSLPPEIRDMIWTCVVPYIQFTVTEEVKHGTMNTPGCLQKTRKRRN